MNDLNNIIIKRRSTRIFLDKNIEEDKLKKIIIAGINAPSACNEQAWRFKILDKNQKEKIVKIGGADFIKDSPVAIIVTYPKTDNNYMDYIQSASACIQNMLLMATELGIGSCWVCHLPPKWKIRKLLNIPNNYEIISCVVFGYPRQENTNVPRMYSYDEFFIFEKKNKRNILKYLYTRQPIRPKIIERIFTKRFKN